MLHASFFLHWQILKLESYKVILWLCFVRKLIRNVVSLHRANQNVTVFGKKHINDDIIEFLLNKKYYIWLIGLWLKLARNQKKRFVFIPFNLYQSVLRALNAKSRAIIHYRFASRAVRASQEILLLACRLAGSALIPYRRHSVWIFKYFVGNMLFYKRLQTIGKLWFPCKFEPFSWMWLKAVT